MRRHRPLASPRACLPVPARCDRPRLEVDDANLVVLGVGDVEQIAIEREALRPIEARLRENAVVVALQARADRLDQLAVERRDDDAVVVRVGDEEAIRLLVGEDLAGIQQRPIGVAAALEIERQRRSVELAALVEHAHDGANRADESFEVALAHRRADQVAGRVDDDARRPRLRAVALPDLVIGVVGDRMLDLVAHAGCACRFSESFSLVNFGECTPITTSSSGKRCSSVLRSRRTCMQLTQP